MTLASIKTRILTLSLICLFVALGAAVMTARYFDDKTGALVGAQVSQMLDGKSTESLQRMAAQQAAVVQAEVDTAFHAARIMADSMTMSLTEGSSTPPAQRRAQLNALLKGVLIRFPGLNGTYSAFEPDALDGRDEAHRNRAELGSDQTGRALPYWTRDAQGRIGVQPLAEYDSADRHANGLIKGGWYLGPKASQRESLLAPLPYIVQGRAVFLATMSVPVMVGGRFMGVTGADFDLDFMQKLAKDVNARIYDGAGSVAIVTQDGLVVASSRSPDAIGRGYDTISGASPLALADVRGGQAKVVRESTRDEISVYSPIKAGLTGNNWSVVVTVPRSVVLKDVAALEQTMEGQRSDSARWQLGLAGLIALLGAVLMWLVSRSIANPIVQLTEAMNRLAGRETGVVVPCLERKDEIGAMARTVGVIQQNAVEDAVQASEAAKAQDLRMAQERRATMARLADEFEQAVGGIIGTVSRASNDLQGAASVLQTAATTTTERSATVAQASQNASQNVNTVAAAAEELANSVSEISQKMDESARMSSNAVTEASQTAKTVHELAEAAQRIGEISDLISNVAGQTNLLALNATIEAARAGEAGRGFAVVAAEVKGLADQTAKAAAQISTQIGAVQSSTHSAVAAIGSITQTIDTMNEISAAIAAAVEEQAATTQEIARNVQRASSGTADVTVNIGSVNSAAVETSSAAAQVLGASSELSRQSSALGAEVNRFLETVRAG